MFDKIFQDNQLIGMIRHKSFLLIGYPHTGGCGGEADRMLVSVSEHAFDLGSPPWF